MITSMIKAVRRRLPDATVASSDDGDLALEVVALAEVVDDLTANSHHH